MNMKRLRNGKVTSRSERRPNVSARSAQGTATARTDRVERRDGEDPVQQTSTERAKQGLGVTCTGVAEDVGSVVRDGIDTAELSGQPTKQDRDGRACWPNMTIELA